MRIIQFGSTGVTLILQEQITNLLSDVVAISGYFFFFCMQVHKPILLVLYHGVCFTALVPAWSSIVGTTSFERIFQTSLCSEVL